jgi:hypothetical protein
MHFTLELPQLGKNSRNGRKRLEEGFGPDPKGKGRKEHVVET